MKVERNKNEGKGKGSRGMEDNRKGRRGRMEK